MNPAINQTINSAANSAMNHASNPPLQLKDIHLPPAISWWPPAPGWWLLGIALIAVIAGVIFFSVRHHRNNAYRRAALIELDAIFAQWQVQKNHVQLAASCNQLARRIGLHIAGQDCAALTGEKWLQWLDSTLEGKQFTQAVGYQLIDASYRPAANYNAHALQQLMQTWISKHRVP